MQLPDNNQYHSFCARRTSRVLAHRFFYLKNLGVCFHIRR